MKLYTIGYSGKSAEKCHRRLIAEYIKFHMNSVEIIHL